MNTNEIFIASARRIFHSYKTLADRAIDQTDEAGLHTQQDDESNSIAIIIQHMAGNMLSRWTDFFTSDGEKENRNRDAEFTESRMTREELLIFWEKGWSSCFHIIDNLREDDLLKTITIRKEPHTVIDAVNRQIAHYAYHVGQIVYLCRMYRKEAWKSLSIPKNKSADFNTKMGM